MLDPLIAAETGVTHTLQCPPCESGFTHAVFFVFLGVLATVLAAALAVLYRLHLQGVDRREIRSAAVQRPASQYHQQHQAQAAAPASSRAYVAYARSLPVPASKLPLSHFSPV